MSQFPKNLRAVIFDLDGTLVDTAEEFVQVVNAMRDEDNLEPLPEAIIRANVSNGSGALVTLAYGIEKDHRDFSTQRQRLLDKYSTIIGDSARPYPGITDLLQDLQNRGINWGIATNKPRAYTEPLLAALAFEPAPLSVTCPDDVTQGKPHPEALLLNLKQMQCLPHEAVYVGDHLRDIQAGRGAGLYTIAATYGYIEDHDDPATWRANAYAHCSTELAALLSIKEQFI
ncbi:MAG: phosphoglycolate phosphatase [Gammaproteobacteria bacterium]|nr:MAG: phosphoglycolate phosphatase [Gammaproteobacteria bacterium]